MKFFLVIFGCAMNVNDADRLRTVLTGIGGTEVESVEESDLNIFVTCSVRQHAEDRVHGYLNKIVREKGKGNVINAITGCMARKTGSRKQEGNDPLLKRCPAVDITFRIEDASRLPELLKDYFPIVSEFGGEFPGIFQTIPTQKQAHSALVPISTGCDHHCTFCIVPYTRGKEVCRSKEEILEECRTAISKGAKEITLLGQNVNRYYFNERGNNPYKTDFAVLLDEIATLEGLKWLRFLSPHPQHLAEDVIEVMAKHPTICRHLHLPAQSGDDELLRKMARGYTAQKFRETVALARQKIPRLSVTTDIIVGFCGETEEQFQNTLLLAEDVGFDKIFISKFSPRPNTPAAKWPDDVSLDEKKRRYHELNAILKKTAKRNNRSDLGRQAEVMIDSLNEETGIAQGHTNENKIIFLPVDSENTKLVGEIVITKVTEAETFYLKGEIVVPAQKINSVWRV